MILSSAARDTLNLAVAGGGGGRAELQQHQKGGCWSGMASLQVRLVLEGVLVNSARFGGGETGTPTRGSSRDAIIIFCVYNMYTCARVYPRLTDLCAHL